MSEASFFERYFERLDGDDPHSAFELVSDDVEFAILFATRPDAKAGHFVGGIDDLKRFTDAGDMSGWAHYILAVSRDGDVETVLGETRTDAGEVLGTFVSAAHLDADGRMRKYIVGRSPAIRFGDSA